jgi:hypothetical protein
MNLYWGSGGRAPRILDFGTRWRRVVSFTPRPLYTQGKSSWYPLDRRLGGHQSRFGGGGEENNPQHLPGLESPIIQPIARRYTTELSRPLVLLRYFLYHWGALDLALDYVSHCKLSFSTMLYFQISFTWGRRKDSFLFCGCLFDMCVSTSRGYDSALCFPRRSYRDLCMTKLHVDTGRYKIFYMTNCFT